MAHPCIQKNMAKQMTGVAWHVHLLVSHGSSSKHKLDVSHAHSTLIFEGKRPDYTAASLHRHPDCHLLGVERVGQQFSTLSGVADPQWTAFQKFTCPSSQK